MIENMTVTLEFQNERLSNFFIKILKKIYQIQCCTLYITVSVQHTMREILSFFHLKNFEFCHLRYNCIMNGGELLPQTLIF